MNFFEIMLLSGGVIGIMYYFFDVKKRNGFVYGRFGFAHENLMASFENPDDIKSGYRWTPVNELESQFKDGDAIIDKFQVDDKFAKKCKIPKWYRKQIEKTEIKFTSLQLTKSLLFIGKMGSGKTEMLHNLLSQRFYDRAIIHQLKRGDFVEPFYRPKIDIILNPYDERGHLWDIMQEDEGIVQIFFLNYMNSVMGDKKDFFSSTAQRYFNETMNTIKTQYKDQPSSKKWLLFIQAVKEMFREAESKSQNSKKDVMSTMESLIEPLEIMAWMMQNPKQKTFTIQEFFNKKNQCKLILDNSGKYKVALTPLFSAFISCLTQIHISQPETKTDFTMYCLDEYLSLSSTMDDDSRTRLHTGIRGIGGQLLAFLQYVPSDSKKLKQLLGSSAFAWFYFSEIEEDSIALLKNTLGQTEYYYEDVNISYSEGKKTKSYSTKRDKTELFGNNIINGLGSKYKHIVYIPDYEMIYEGYTPQVKLKKRSEKFIERDLTEFKNIKYKLDDSKIKTDEEIRNLTFADLFKQKPLSKLDEYKLYKKFEAAKAKDKVQEFKKEENLQNVDIELLFEDYIQKDAVIDSKMKILSSEERIALANEWNSIKDDDAKAFQFIEKHQLWGACPGLFEKDLEALEDI